MLRHRWHAVDFGVEKKVFKIKFQFNSKAKKSRISKWFLDILNHSISKQWKVVYYGQFHGSLLPCSLSMKPHQHLLLFVKLLPIHQSHALISSFEGSSVSFDNYCHEFWPPTSNFSDNNINFMTKDVKLMLLSTKNKVTSLTVTQAAQQSRSNKQITVQNW